MRLGYLSLAACVLVGASGCGLETVAGLDSQLGKAGENAADPTIDASTAETGTDAAPSEPEPAPPSRALDACSRPERGVAAPTSDVEVVDLLVGDWILCSTESLFCTQDEVGLQIQRDGTWAKLYANGPDALAAATGSAEHGTWTILANANTDTAVPYYQLDLASERGVIYTLPAFTSDGNKVRMSNNGVCTGDYVRSTARDDGEASRLVDGVPVEPTPTPVHVNASLGQLCGAPESGVVGFESADAFTTSLVGYWALCTAESAFCTAESGLEIAGDGTWYKLYADGDGRLWRGLGWGRRGRWEILDVSGHYQLNLLVDGSGTLITAPMFAPEPLKMRLDNNGVCLGDYVNTAQ